jgi:hypothetical protein
MDVQNTPAQKFILPDMLVQEGASQFGSTNLVGAINYVVRQRSRVNNASSPKFHLS